MYISQIKWPQNRDEKVKLYLSFMVKSVEKLNIKFPDKLADPIYIAHEFLGNNIQEKDYSRYADEYWNYIDTRNAVQEFKERDVLAARLGICLLSANRNLDEVSYGLAWFFEVLDYLKINLEPHRKLMREHFEFTNVE